MFNPNHPYRRVIYTVLSSDSRFLEDHFDVNAALTAKPDDGDVWQTDGYGWSEPLPGGERLQDRLLMKTTHQGDPK